MDKDEIVNTLLQHISIKPTRFSGLYSKYISRNDEGVEFIFDRMIELNLMKVQSEEFFEDSVVLTDFGDDVKKEGGWIEYNRKRNKETIDQIQEEKKKEGIREAEKQAEKTEKRLWKFLTLILAIVSTAVSIRQCTTSDKANDLENLNLKQREQVESLKLDSTNKVHLLKTKEKELLELRKTLDSLDKKNVEK